MREIQTRNRLPLIVGGTCYYAYNLFLQLQKESKFEKEIEKTTEILNLEAKFNEIIEMGDESARQVALDAVFLRRVQTSVQNLIP